MSATNQPKLSKTRGGYKDALALLSARARRVRPTEPADGYTGPTPGLKGEASITGMQEWMEVLGHDAASIKSLNTIHVAGTKGKGSTCAFIESLLRAHGQRTGFPRKTGMYTGPKLLTDTERIRFNFEPISEELLARYTFETHDILEEALSSGKIAKGPRLLQMWVLLAFHTSIMEGVDVAIIETNHGGEFDSTNFVPEPVVTAITTLGMDHIEQLGPTQANIAWHKAGIFKKGAAALSAPQVGEAAAALVERAEEKGVSLEFVEPSLPDSLTADMPSEVYNINCSVAIATVNAWLKALRGQCLSAEDIAAGVAQFSWPGRFQRLTHGREQWYLDAAHNTLSMSKAARWFARATSGVSSGKLLIFTNISVTRDGPEVLAELLRALREDEVKLTAVVFCSYARLNSGQPLATASLVEVFTAYKKVLAEWHAEIEAHTADTVDEAVSVVHAIAAEQAEPHILATGSQYLLGGILHVLAES